MLPGFLRRMDRAWAGTPSNEAALLPALAVISYNILLGAGVSPYWQSRLPDNDKAAYGGHRLGRILQIVEAAQPDILGIQEANGWGKGQPTVVQEVASRLGMNYFYAPTPSGFDLALLSRYTITQAENLTPLVGHIGALRATVATPGSDVQVMVVHMGSNATELQRCALGWEVVRMRGAPVIVMGDMNSGSACLPLLRAGLKQAVCSGSSGIDQIYLSPSLLGTLQRMQFPKDGLAAASDHEPIGVSLRMKAAATAPSLQRVAAAAAV